MARTVLTAQTIVRTGLTPSFAAVDAANGESFDNTYQNLVLYVKNGAGAPINVTIGVASTVDGLTVPDLVVAVPAGGEKIIGPFPNNVYGQEDPDSGIDPSVFVDYSSGTTITVALIDRGSIGY